MLRERPPACMRAEIPHLRSSNPSTLDLELSTMSDVDCMNREGLGRFADAISAAPLGMSSIEEAQNLMGVTGIAMRVACGVRMHECRVIVGTDDSTKPEVITNIYSREARLELDRYGEGRWQGGFEFPWDDFCMLLSYAGRSAKVRIHGSCSADVEGHHPFDETVPVIALGELGAAMVRIITGEAMPPAPYCSEFRAAIHTARCAAEVLSKLAKES